MRFYRIVITDPKTGELLLPNVAGKSGFTRVPPNASKSTYTSLNPNASVFTNGGTNANAQQVILDVPVALMHQPEQTNAIITVKGVSIGEINQANNLANMNISVYGGMAKGLPLANPGQSGILAQGQIQRCQGNWVGNETSIQFILYTGTSSPSSNQTTANPNTASSIAVPSTNNKPANIVFRWTKGQLLIDAIKQALIGPFPMYKIQGAISANLVWSSGQDAIQVFATLEQFATWVHERSLHMLGGYDPDPKLYMGVNIAYQNNTITIFDGSTPTTPKQIQFVDMVGQTKWLSGITLQSVLVMRGDIQVGDYVSLPPAVGEVSSGAPTNNSIPRLSLFTSNATFYTDTPSANAKDSSIFQGTYYVSSVRHVGDSRDPNGLSWLTVLELRYIPQLDVNSNTQLEAAQTLPTIYTGSSATGYFLP